MTGRSREESRQELLSRLSASPGLCATCVHLELKDSGRSVFVRCALAGRDPAWPRYPPLPVRACAGHEEKRPPGAAGGSTGER